MTTRTAITIEFRCPRLEAAKEKSPNRAMLVWGIFAGKPLRQILAERFRIVNLRCCRMSSDYAVAISFVNIFN
jgi:hypothetical protein